MGRCGPIGEIDLPLKFPLQMYIPRVTPSTPSKHPSGSRPPRRPTIGRGGYRLGVMIIALASEPNLHG